MKDSNSTEKKRIFTEADAAWDKGDLRQAFALFQKGARLGDSSCQVDLGYFFDEGLFTRKNRRMALYWYYKAYRQGEAGGANNIATVYRDMGQTTRMLWWLRRAADMGDTQVMLDLGGRYEMGIGVSRNLTRAKAFYRRVLASKLGTKDEKVKARLRLSILAKSRV